MFAAATALLWLAGSLPASADAPQRWALLVGVGDNVRPKFNLYGPKNDVPAVADLLRGQYGFPESHILRLLNGDATRKNVLDGWAWLARSAKPGDIVVFYYSGHGTAIPGRAGASDPSNLDGLDSALCPFDAVNSTGLIAGKEIGECIDRIPTDQVVVIVDACNSGRATRDIRSRRRALNATDFGLPPVHVPAAAETPGTQGAVFAGGSASNPKAHKETYIGAARIDQSALEGPYLDGSPNSGSDASSGDLAHRDLVPENPNMGALTFYLLQELRAAGSSAAGSPAVTYSELVRRVRGDLRKEYGDDAQEPQIVGPDPENTRFLAARGVTSEPADMSGRGATALPVALALTTGAGAGASVELRAIAGAALLPGSILQVGGEKRWVEEDATPGGGEAKTTGLVKITEVRGTTATGKVLSGRAPAGFALSEVMRPAPDGRLRVAIGGEGPRAESLRTLAAAVDSVVVVDAKKPSDVTLYPSVSGGAADSEHAVDIYRNGVALPSIAEADVSATLEGMQRVKRLANLQSAPDSPIHLKVTQDGKEGFSSARIGDKIKYEIAVDRDAYITILDLTPDGKVIGATTDKISAGHVTVLPTSTVEAPAGLDTLKVIATTFPVTMDLPSSAELVNTMGAAGKAAAVAQRVLDALSVGSMSSAAGRAGTKGLDLRAIARSGGVADSAIAVDGWACVDQLLRIDPKLTGSAGLTRARILLASRRDVSRSKVTTFPKVKPKERILLASRGGLSRSKVNTIPKIKPKKQGKLSRCRRKN